MSPSFVNVFVICLYATLCLCCSEATPDIQKNSSIQTILAFGDSFLDSGNNNFKTSVIKANFLPYGKDFMGGKPTGRFTNGKTIGDYIVEKLGVKDYLPAYLDTSLQNEDMVTGVSFASGGSGFDPLTAQIGNVFSLAEQIEMFKEYIVKLKGIVGDGEADNIISKSLYLVTCSSNDWAIGYTAVAIRRLQYNPAAYGNFLVERATEFIQEMYTLGARKIVFFNTPFIGCFPLARTMVGGILRKCGDDFNDVAQSFNRILNDRIQSLGSSMHESRFTIVDYFKVVQDIMEHSLQYGLEVVDRGCCGTGIVEVGVLCNQLSPVCPDDTKYLFWDSVHPTDKGNSIIVDHVLQNMMNNLF
ncbi:GDSL esterase/lipase At5g42170-like [Bidens hawaiensis]|uniref:GDSL esterase/lipase At5g42170-like n=1 Tax=Bidens hawaiensis TaxID=980011 RepID=UPI00404A322B